MKRYFKYSVALLVLGLYILNFIGCATAPYEKPIVQPKVPGIYHRVKKGDTLWRISKLYNQDLEMIASINHISDNTKIEEGQLVFIPNRQKVEAPVENHISEDFIWPIKGRVIATFGETRNNMINRGINISPSNQPDVIAARSGKVSFYKDGFGHFGKTIIIDHGDGFSTVYARNSIVYIRAGDIVKQGAIIARAGSVDPDKFNVYLHFEIRKGHIPQNPYYYLP